MTRHSLPYPVLLIGCLLVTGPVIGYAAELQNYAAADRAVFAVVSVEGRPVSPDTLTVLVRVLEGEQIAPGTPLSLKVSESVTGQTFLVPFLIKEGRWRQIGSVTEVNRIQPRQGKRALSEIANWQMHSRLPVIQRLDHWLSLIGHPVSYLHVTAVEALRHHRAELSAVMTPSRLEVLTTAMQEREGSLERRRTLLNLISSLGQESGADWIAAHLFSRISSQLRGRALRILGYHRTPQSLHALARCAKETEGATADLCTRLLGVAARVK